MHIEGLILEDSQNLEVSSKDHKYRSDTVKLFLDYWKSQGKGTLDESPWTEGFPMRIHINLMPGDMKEIKLATPEHGGKWKFRSKTRYLFDKEKVCKHIEKREKNI